MCVLRGGAHVCRYQKRPLDSPRAGITEGCEPPVSVKNQTQSPEGVQVLLSTEHLPRPLDEYSLPFCRFSLWSWFSLLKRNASIWYNSICVLFLLFLEMLGIEPRASMPVKHSIIELFPAPIFSRLLFFFKSKFVLIHVFYLQNEFEDVFTTILEFSSMISNISKLFFQISLLRHTVYSYS